MRASQLLSAFAVAAVAVAFPTNEKRSSPTGKFQVYAYGDSIGGLPLFTSGGTAYIGDPSLMSSNQCAPVIFTDSEGHLYGAPNMTKVGDYKPSSSWTNLTLYIPSSSSSSHAVGFQNSSTSASGRSMNSFSFYGSWMGATGDDGAWQTLWYAVATDTDGVYSLQWNPTGDTDGQTLLTLKTTPPSDV